MAIQHKTQRRQRGGTFLGMVVGLVVGLAVALVVAVYVTNIPVPFLHKAASRMPIQDEAEAARNQGWNPNAVLQGDHTPEPVSSGTTPSAAAPGGTAPLNMPPPPAVVGGSPVPVAPNSSAPVTMPESGNGPVPTNANNNRPSGAVNAPHATTAQSESNANSDPLGALVASRLSPRATTAASANAPAAGNGFSYFVQAGAFGSAPDADAQRARLLLSGVRAQVSSGGTSGQAVYRVRVGPFNSERAAQQVQSRLKQDGFEVALIRAEH